jgi:hypothetical protein
MTQKKSDCIVVYVDLLGFKKEAKDAPESTMLKLEEVRKWLKANIDKKGYAKSYMLSDSCWNIYPVTPGITKDARRLLLANCILDSRRLLDIFNKNDLFPRGGITYGRVVFDEEQILGEAINIAVSMETDICPGPFIVVSRKQLLRALDGDDLALTCMPNDIFKIKNDAGLMLGCVLLPTDILSYLDKLCQKKEYYLSSDCYTFADYWSNAYDFVLRLLRDDYDNS